MNRFNKFLVAALMLAPLFLSSAGCPRVSRFVCRQPQPQGVPRPIQDNRRLPPRGAPWFGALPNRGSFPLDNLITL